MSFTMPFIGRLGEAWVKTEGAANYGVSPTLASTDAFRHLDLDLITSPLSRENAKDRYQTPDMRRRITHRNQSSWALKNALMWPSGTLGTAPELDVMLTNGFGAKRSITPLSTTVAASPSPTTTVFTVAAVTGLAVNDPVTINVAGVGECVRWITAINTLALTVAPALPTAPTTGDTVKSGISYAPATNPASAFTIAHYLLNSAGSSPATFSREMNGCIVDKFEMTFDANQEPMIALSGPAKSQTKPAQTIPGAFTTVGTVIPSGISGGLRVGAAAYPFLKAVISIENTMAVRNAEYGTSSAIGFYRRGQRQVTVQLDAYVEDPTAIYDNGITAAPLTLLLQTGVTAGKQWAVYLPAVEFDVPSTPDGDNELVWSFKGVALGTLGNDELFLGQL